MTTTRDFTAEAERVLSLCEGEIQVNLEASDVHAEADIAADVVERLIAVYALAGYNRDASDKATTTADCAAFGEHFDLKVSGHSLLDCPTREATP
jgi:hypothetical protein